ncbi:signal peptidase I [Actinomadura violacea]|uniref:signal peptidase I n=1 Tax=Actinomadura violacea TaxID=2819934 RepID=UPI001E5FCCB0|nr:signal peptidase I [Actinomadura violacea]
MQNTLGIGDRALVNKIVYHTRDVRYGDIVVFKGEDSWAKESTAPAPSNPFSEALRSIGGAFGLMPGETDYIKRVIGLPGDRVQCVGAGTPVRVNGKLLDEKSYLYPGNSPCDQPFDITVPKDRLWVMGDQPSASADSRAHNQDPGGGAIKISSVVGQAFAIVWPLDRWKAL